MTRSSFLTGPLPGMALLLAAIMFAAVPCAAEDEWSDSLPSLRFPTPAGCPALAIINAEPSFISRPHTPTNLSVNGLSDDRGEGELPACLSIEVSPFWLLGLDPPGGYGDYSSPPGILESMAQTCLISVAAGPTVGDTTSISVGTGLRMSLVQGEVQEDYDGLVRIFRQLLESSRHSTLGYARQIDDFTGLRTTAWAEATQADWDRLTADLLAMGEHSGLDFSVARALLERRELRRTGWKLDMACAIGFDVDKDSGSVADGASAAWLTGGYDMGGTAIMASGRAISIPGLDGTALDMGCALFQDCPGPLRASAETGYRSVSGDGSWRVAGTVEVAIGSNRSLSLTLGRDFDNPGQDRDLTSVFLTLGFGSKRPLL